MPERPLPDAAPSGVPDLAGLTHPLDGFYAEAGLVLPPLQRVDPEEVPAPFKQLLVHQNDMTPTLEAFYGRTLHIRALGSRRNGEDYRREVVLLTEGDEDAVEFGANRIRLGLFPEAAQRLILEEREPLGHILRDFNLVHTCLPNAFFRVASDKLINEALRLRGAQVLYGRHNQLYDPQGRLLSEVVEILRPPG